MIFTFQDGKQTRYKAENIGGFVSSNPLYISSFAMGSRPQVVLRNISH